MNEPDCVFCALLEGRAPLSVVGEEDLVVAFLDAFPVAPGHVLVVPRRHAASLQDLTPDEGAAMFSLARGVATRLRERLAPAVNLHLSDGAEAGQDVPHVHLHVIPRHADDPVVLHLPGASASRAELDRVAASLAAGGLNG